MYNNKIIKEIKLRDDLILIHNYSWVDQKIIYKYIYNPYNLYDIGIDLKIRLK